MDTANDLDPCRASVFFPFPVFEIVLQTESRCLSHHLDREGPRLRRTQNHCRSAQWSNPCLCILVWRSHCRLLSFTNSRVYDDTKKAPWFLKTLVAFRISTGPFQYDAGHQKTVLSG